MTAGTPNFTTEGVLALSTSTPAVSVALAVDGMVVGARQLRRERRHVEDLIPLVDEVLTSAGRGLDELTAMAVDIGPGLFTGIRVGVVTAASLALTRGLGVVAASSIDVLRATVDPTETDVWIAVDGRRGDVFLAPARRDSAELEPAFAVVALDDALRLLAERVARVVVGDGVGPLRDAAAASGAGIVWVDGGPDRLFPDAAALAQLAHTRLQTSPRELRDPRAVRPLYGREADAVANFRTRHNP